MAGGQDWLDEQMKGNGNLSTNQRHLDRHRGSGKEGVDSLTNALASAAPPHRRPADPGLRLEKFTMKWPWLVLMALGAVAGCGPAGGATTADAAPMPSTVVCADASALTSRALDARRQSAALTGDRARIIGGNRANFLASLATIAQLKCRTGLAEADALLGQALEVARQAEATTSEYEAAIRWTEADLIAADAVALLIGGIPAPAAP